MTALPLSLACAAYDRMVPLLTGEVRPAGIDLNFIPIASPREVLDRMVGRRCASVICSLRAASTRHSARRRTSRWSACVFPGRSQP
jgi:4,5-dihydroxyphthalate decarboxylase